MFNIGAHIIALNLQTPDQPHYLLHSKFLENGGVECGYLLKPQWMRSSAKLPKYPSHFNTVVSKVKIRVESGQKVILAETKQKNIKLVAYLKGNRYEENPRQEFKSAVIVENGFHPMFELDCEFTVYCPDLAMFVFDILSQDQSEVLSSIGISYTCLRSGLRVAPLLGPTMRFGKGSYLLMWIKVKEKKHVGDEDEDEENHGNKE